MKLSSKFPQSADDLLKAHSHIIDTSGNIHTKISIIGILDIENIYIYNEP